MAIASVLVALLQLTQLSLVVAQSATARSATPVDPIAAILHAFGTHDIVAVTDPHGNVQVQAFLLSLVRDPRFSAAVNDIVIETASARYQDCSRRSETRPVRRSESRPPEGG